MDKWYCREPIPSTVAASQLVFNINDCVDKSRVIQTRPPRPPDSNGRECYVYVLDGSSVRNIRDLPIDDLAPWNSKMCKSSTRFNAVSFNPHQKDMVMRRYIVSDTDNVPECLLACYYCKHPTFRLAKKIFYACDGRREACLPGSYVVFIYEFDGVEKLYQRTYQNGSSNRQPSGPRRHLTAAASASLNGSSPGSNGHTPTSTRRAINAAPSLTATGNNGTGSAKRSYGDISDDILQTRSALEAVMNATNNNNILTNNNNDSVSLDETLSNLFASSGMKLDDLLQCSQLFAENFNNNNNNKALAALPIAVPTSTMSNGSATSGAKRRKVSNSVRVNYSPVLATTTKPKTIDPIEFRYVHTSDVMLENFRRNGLCDAEKFASFCDLCVDEDTAQIGARDLGGCMLIEPTFQSGRYFFTVLWFRNPTFLLNGVPAVQPAAILVANEKKSDDYTFLLNDIQMKVQISGKVVRSVLAPESLALEEFSAPGAMFAYPSIRLNCARNFQKTVSERFPNEDLSEIFSTDLFGTGKPEGLLNAQRFEDFVCRLGQMDKKWPAGFRTWFREKSGWIFERLSYGSRMKAGFTGETPTTLEDLLSAPRESFTQRFNALVESSGFDFGLLAAVSVLDELTNEIFVRSAQAIFSNDEQSLGASSTKLAIIEEEEPENQTAGPSSSVSYSSSVNGADDSNITTPEKQSDSGLKNSANQMTLHSSLCSLYMTRLQWRNCDAEKRQEILSELGIPSMLPCELCIDTENGINPVLLKALSRQERIELLSKAFELVVSRVDLKSFAMHKTQDSDEPEPYFVVFDKAEKSVCYVSVNHSKNMTYCQCQKQKIANFTTSVVKTLICEHLCAVALVDQQFTHTLNMSFQFGATSPSDGDAVSSVTSNIATGGDNVESCSSVDSCQSKQLPFDIKLEGGVEIIRCAAQSNGSDSGSETPTINKIMDKPRNGVDSIINNLHNRRNCAKSNEAPPPKLQPFDSNCSPLENAVAMAQKLVNLKSLATVKQEGENLY